VTPDTHGSLAAAHQTPHTPGPTARPGALVSRQHDIGTHISPHAGRSALYRSTEESISPAGRRSQGTRDVLPCANRRE